jgi:hypothetical protein
MAKKILATSAPVSVTVSNSKPGKPTKPPKPPK